MRRLPPWTALWSAALAAVLFGGAALSTSPANAQTDGTWLLVGLPSDRDGHSAVYDAARDRMVAFGGMSSTRRNDVWVLPLSSATGWHQMLVGGTPPSARDGHTAVYDPVNDRMVVFGGFDTGHRNDVWTLSFAGVPTWLQILPGGSPPAPRVGHAAVYDPVRQRMIVIGGVDDGIYNNEVWELTLSGEPAWNQLTVQGSPNPRAYHSAIYDPDGDRIVMFGGIDAVTGVSRETWVLSLAGTPTWSLMAPSGPLPLARLKHGAVHDPVQQRMLLFGGEAGDSFDDAWSLTLGATPTWTLLHPSGFAYPPRHAHSDDLRPRAPADDRVRRNRSGGRGVQDQRGHGADPRRAARMGPSGQRDPAVPARETLRGHRCAARPHGDVRRNEFHGHLVQRSVDAGSDGRYRAGLCSRPPARRPRAGSTTRRSTTRSGSG